MYSMCLNQVLPVPARLKTHTPETDSGFRVYSLAFCHGLRFSAYSASCYTEILRGALKPKSPGSPKPSLHAAKLQQRQAERPYHLEFAPKGGRLRRNGDYEGPIQACRGCL